MNAVQVHPDYVFAPDYTLESIEDHAAYMWEHRHLSALKGAVVKEGKGSSFEVGAMSYGMLEELEKAHIYISQLNERIKALESQIDEIKSHQQD